MSATLMMDEAVERAVLGAILLRAGAMDEVADVIEPAHFGRWHHGMVFEAMAKLHRSGQTLDPITVSAELERMGRLTEIGKPFVYMLPDGVPRASNVLGYALEIRDKALLRAVHDAARRIAAAAEDGTTSGSDLLRSAEDAIFNLGAGAKSSEWVSGAEMATETYETIEKLGNEGKPVMGLETGFRDLDQLTLGFQRGDLVILGARPSMGKTALAQQCAMHAAGTRGVAFFSLEMGRRQLAIRSVTAAAEVDGWKLRTGRLSDVDMKRVSDGVAQLGNSSIFVSDEPLVSPIHLRSRLRRLRAQINQPIDLVVVDYLQLMAPLPEDRRESKVNQVAGISRALKLLAKEFDVPFLVLSQLNRQLEKQSDKTPSLADLRDSGAIEQDADVVLLLHRPDVYDPNPQLAGKALLILAKQRNGPTGTVELTWHREQMRFSNPNR